MQDLPEGFRAAVYYADVHGYTYAETAAILNIPRWHRDVASVTCAPTAAYRVG